jgi:S1-C subfamily serine protease
MIRRQAHTGFDHFFIARRAAGYFVSLVLLVFPAVSRAGDQLPTTRPLLDELNRETQELFKQTSPSVVRVQLPLPSVAMEEEIVPATLPSGLAADTTMPSVIDLELRSFVPNSVGIVLDDQRHILVPQYIDPDHFPGPALTLLPDGSLTSATLVGSDRPTQLTVLLLQGGDVKAATMASADPSAGTLLMVLSLNPAFNRLAVWQGWAPEPAVFVTLDGAVTGFSGSRGFIATQRCAAVAQDLIQHGQVRRAILGVGVREVGPDDPQRAKDASLGQTPALRVHSVMAGSAADKAGIQPGDLILELAGQSVGDVADIAAAITDRQGPTPVIILREGQRVTLTPDLQIQ